MVEACAIEAVGRRHAELEAAGDLDGIMATLVPEPVYLFPTVRGRLEGRDNIYRYYRHFVDDFQPRIADYRLLDEWLGEHTLAQEYALHLRDEPGERIMVGILYGEGPLLTGERIYGDRELMQALLGPVFDKLQPLG